MMDCPLGMDAANCPICNGNAADCVGKGGMGVRTVKAGKNTGSGVRPFQTMDAPSGLALGNTYSAPKG